LLFLFDSIIFFSARGPHCSYLPAIIISLGAGHRFFASFLCVALSSFNRFKSSLSRSGRTAAIQPTSCTPEYLFDSNLTALIRSSDYLLASKQGTLPGKRQSQNHVSYLAFSVVFNVTGNDDAKPGDVAVHHQRRRLRNSTTPSPQRRRHGGRYGRRSPSTTAAAPVECRRSRPSPPSVRRR